LAVSPGKPGSYGDDAEALSSLRAFTLLLELLNVQLKAANSVLNELMNIVGAQNLLVP
jgi:hypothetical protein